ncbi:WW domain-binding protein 1 [Channa argus]|uniref:WW domain-binding protein 1 n=1 Tax=Channa argus TaxID=215402 RepID=A0A6G1Q775_CHAAH|nr:WW domain-binding protein 1 [Channa argus]
MEYHSGGSLPLLGRPRYCPGANANGGYLCETGHCCGETGCCTYYYELWWFWLLWTVLILFSCCCAYRHRRAKLRIQQQQRQREISLLAYHGANSYPSSMLDLSFLASLKLPSYEEVAAQPSTPPPPYSSVFTAPRYPQPPRAADPHLLTQHDPLLHRPVSDGPSSLSSDNSSSCSCDSCCPSSPCSSSLSAPVTYETDTSHASTPSEALPLTLDVTMEAIAAATTCLEVNERMVTTAAIDTSDADAARAQEPVATDLSVPNQTVTVAVVTRAASPQSVSSPVTDALPVGTTSPLKKQLDLAPSLSLPSPPSSPPCLPSPPSLPSPPPLSSSSLPAPALLLDPLTALHQSDKGVSSSGHTSSLSPSPRATQSPPKQTLFSPCVDVFEPGPPNWEGGEDNQEEEDNDDDEDEDMGADESQYRHRRLTGDSGIEVCRCRVEEEEDEEEGEEEGGRKTDGRRGEGEKDSTDLHDSVDCPARGQITTGEGLTLCNPTSTTTPMSEDSGKVIIVMETV